MPLCLCLEENPKYNIINIITIICLPDGDILVDVNSVRVFAKRRQCKGQLELGKEYLIMGKDGSTTDSNRM